MVGSERLLEILENALKLCAGDQAEARIVASDSQLTRYANSVIHQNVAETSARLSVKIYIGKKMGRAGTNDLSPESIRRTAKRAHEIAKLSPENPEFVSLPGPGPIPQVKSHFESTANADPDRRADNVLAIVERAKARGFEAAGAHSTSVREMGVANTLGVRAYGASTAAELTCVILSGDGSGYAQASSRDIDEIDAAAIAQEAIERCAMNTSQESIEPGEYVVLFEPYAAADLVWNLANLGLSARTYQDGQSFLSGNMGKALMSPAVTIWDDGLDPEGAPFPFDIEGQPKKRVPLIDKGRGVGVVYDSFTGFREELKESTGHASEFGASPANLFVAPGERSREEILKSVAHGVLVTRLHYVRAVHSQKTIITGMTRDGTFLIQDGRIKSALKNLRFTQSVVESLATAIEFSKERRLLGVERSVLTPAMLLEKFNFTGRTEH
ncbi:MAG: TldD/PmbA family protein [Bacillota bacterium]|jgi:PmbA protein